jgi:hypothetical protein
VAFELLCSALVIKNFIGPTVDSGKHELPEVGEKRSDAPITKPESLKSIETSPIGLARF